MPSERGPRAGQPPIIEVETTDKEGIAGLACFKIEGVAENVDKVKYDPGNPNLPPVFRVDYLGAETSAARAELAVAFSDPHYTPVMHFCPDKIGECHIGEGVYNAPVLHVSRWRHAAQPFLGYTGEDETRAGEDAAVQAANVQRAALRAKMWGPRVSRVV